LIPLLAVPVSLVGTFILFPLFGFSINTLFLFGLVPAIGLVVDDEIVVVEGVQRHIEEGLTPKKAALKAMEELSGPVVGIALVLSAVFVPTAFIPGITGRLYQQFAVTIAISVILSAFNALTLSPALAALLLRPRQPSRGKNIFLKLPLIFDLPKASQQRLDLVFRAEGGAAFGRIFKNPQETAAYYRFWYRNIQEVFAPRMPTIRPYFAENSQTNRPYFAEENRPFTQGPTEMFA
jgi:multidrug efflux pump subunit AcrB